MIMFQNGFVAEDNAKECHPFKAIFNNKLYMVLSDYQSVLMLYSGMINSRQCLNPITMPNLFETFCKITTFPMSSQSKCVELVQKVKNRQGSLKEIITTINEECDPVNHCDFDLRRYMKPELEDDIFLYNVKIKTIQRFIDETKPLPDPSFASMFKEYL